MKRCFPWAASRRFRGVGWWVVGCTTGAAGLLACGPWLPEQILLARRAVLRTPVGELVREVVALEGPGDAAPTLPPGMEYVPDPTWARDWDYHDDEERPREQLQVELAEFAEVLRRRGVPEGERDALLAAYKDHRAGVEKRDPSGHNAAEDAYGPHSIYSNQPQGGTPATTPSRPLPSLTAILPEEWTDYLQGAESFHAGNPDEARRCWERLLARPLDKRRDRSVWAAFMLARMLDGTGTPTEQAARYQRVRELRAAGCHDGLNLAAASLGWEARLALNAKDFSRAARLYYLQARAGTLDGDSLRVAAEAALGQGKDDPVMLASARDPFLRRVVTLYLACSRDFDESTEAAEAPEPTPSPTPEASPSEQAASDPVPPGTAAPSTRVQLSRDWLAVLQSAGVDNAHEAAGVAWAAYQAGAYRRAADWLRLAPTKDPLALWLRAKLALRAGKIDEAARNFAAALPGFPAERSLDNEVSSSSGRAANGRRFRPRQFQMDLGILQLSRGDFRQAFDSLLRSGFWRDAAYVAEQVLTPEELGQYVRANYPAAPVVPTPKPEEADGTPHDGEEEERQLTAVLEQEVAALPFEDHTAFSLRYLLARRLGRLGRYAEARRYYPAALLPRFDQYVAARKVGDTAVNPKGKRADAYWRAARIERRFGMELFGTEVDPDGYVEGGAFPMDEYRAARLEPPAAAPEPSPAEAPTPPPAYVPPVGAQEKRRLARAQPQPFERYHYRYTAAELAWKAASLMPDQQEDTAKVLAAGGRWLESVDATKAADRFYLAILRRCYQTPLGRTADSSGHLPDVPDEGL